MSKKKLSLNQAPWQGIIGAFQVRDQGNKSLFARVRWLFLFSLLVIVFFFLLQNQQFNILVNRDTLENSENIFLTQFYTTYDSAYYWLDYQSQYNPTFLPEFSTAPSAQVYFADVQALLSSQDIFNNFAYGNLTHNLHYQASLQADQTWALQNTPDNEFITWFGNQNYQTPGIYWAPDRFAPDSLIELFYLYQNPDQSLSYSKISLPFIYAQQLASTFGPDQSGLAIFFSPTSAELRPFVLNDASQAANLEPAPTTPLATAQGLPSFNRFNTLERFSQALSGQINQLYAQNSQGVFPFDFEGEQFWIKFSPVNTQTEFTQLAYIIAGQEPFARFGISMSVVFIFVLIFLALNLLAFIFYYYSYSRRFFFNTRIKDLIQTGESNTLEFKSSLRYDYQEKKLNKALEQVILKSLAAFNNTDGGLLVIGVDDQGKVLGLKNDYATFKKPDRDGFELHARELISHSYGENFAARGLEFFFPVIGKDEICLIKVKKGQRPIYTNVLDKNGNKNEKFYIRLGNSSREIEKPSDIITYQAERFGRKLWPFRKR